MNTTQIANKLIEICRNGNWAEATNSLYADNIVSIEPDGALSPKRTEGIEAKRQKDVQFSQMVEEFISSEVSEPIISNNYFTVSMKVKAKFKEMGEVTMEELAVYHVNDEGKIDFEEFYYDTSNG